MASSGLVESGFIYLPRVPTEALAHMVAAQATRVDGSKAGSRQGPPPSFADKKAAERGGVLTLGISLAGSLLTLSKTAQGPPAFPQTPVEA